MSEVSPEKKVYFSTGRRKEAIARVRVISGGKGKIIVNGKNYEEYFTTINSRELIKKTLTEAGVADKVDVIARLSGGGISGQAGALSLGIARSLVTLEPSLKATLRHKGFLTRDPRAKERKKYGRKGARRSFQWTKR